MYILFLFYNHNSPPACWEGYDIEDVATPGAWRKNPKLVLEFYNYRRKNVLDAAPNAAHYGLAELEKNWDVHIITQNIDDRQTLIDKGRYSAADILQLAIEKKLSFAPGEPDTAVMLHEAEYELNGERKIAGRYLVLKDDEGSAIDMIMGLTLGIAVKLLLTEKLPSRGLQIPIRPEIYSPVMNELAENGIVFKDYEA